MAAKTLKTLGFKRQYLSFPYVIICALFVIVPLILLFIYAFTDANGAFTLNNFVKFFTNPGVFNTLGLSFLMAICTTGICLLFAYPLALMLANSKINKYAITVLLFVLPMWINSLLRIYSVQTMLEIFKIERGFFSVLVGMVYDFFPFMLLPLFTTLSNIDKSYIEASADLGSPPARSFLRVTLPLSVPGIISGTLMVFMPTISTFAITEMLGTSDIYMFGNLINGLFARGHWNLGSAYAFIMLILIAITLVLSNLIGRKNVGSEGDTTL